MISNIQEHMTHKDMKATSLSVHYINICRHWIGGPKMGETEIFVDNLPGLPDNIRSGSNETFWVGLAAVRHSGQFSLLDYLADKPHIRKYILQVIVVDFVRVKFIKIF